MKLVKTITILFKLSVHLFLFLSLLILASLNESTGRSGVLYYLDTSTRQPVLSPFLGLAFIGYSALNFYGTLFVQSLRRRGMTSQVLQTMVYLILGLCVIFLVIYLGPHRPSISVSATSLDEVLIIITAATGLISAITGIISQWNARKKVLEDSEIERQKLAIEREKIDLEKKKLGIVEKRKKQKK